MMVIEVFFCEAHEKSGSDGAWEARLRDQTAIYDIASTPDGALRELMNSTPAHGRSGIIGDYEVVVLNHDPHAH